MTNIDYIQGDVVREESDSEPWTFSETLVEKVVTGTLKDLVLARVGHGEDVRSIEVDRSDGTCEICGSNSEAITILVDGVVVYEGYDSTGMDYSDSPNPFVEFNQWLNGK